jgi:hypothetical protein
LLAQPPAAGELSAQPGGARLHLRHRAGEHRAEVDHVPDRSRPQHRERHRAAGELLQRGGQARHRLLLAAELLAQLRAFARGQRDACFRRGNPGLGLLDARGERGGLARGALRGVARGVRVALEPGTADLGAPRSASARRSDARISAGPPGSAAGTPAPGTLTKAPRSSAPTTGNRAEWSAPGHPAR